MNLDSHSPDPEGLRKEVLSLRSQLNLLDGRCRNLEEACARLVAPVAAKPVPTPEPRRTAATETPTPPKLPGMSPVPESPKLSTPYPTKQESTDSVPARSGKEAPGVPASPKEDLEYRLGSFWFVRVGIVLLLTGVVFLAKLAYENWIVDMGPAGRVISLYGLSASLVGLGHWFRKKEEKLRNYGQVLLAGGLAMGYFTTYAAHYFDALRIIESPTLAGLLLMTYASLIVWLANRVASERIAIIAMGLAYYSAIVTDVGWFTLVSGVVLTVASITFLARNRWSVLSQVSLVGSYVGWAFWRFVNQGATVLNSGTFPLRDYWIGMGFLTCYWTLFTVAGLTWMNHSGMSGQRNRFLTINNALLIGLGALATQLTHPDHFWCFPSSVGLVLLSLWIGTERYLGKEPAISDTYLIQGSLMVTWGLMSGLSGSSLALSLGIESVALLLLGTTRNQRWLIHGSLVIGAIGLFLGLGQLGRFELEGLALALSLAALFTFCSCWLRKRPDLGILRNLFACMALVLVFAATLRNQTDDTRTLVLSLQALLVITSIRPLRMPDLHMHGLVYLAAALITGVGICLGNHAIVPMANVILSTFAGLSLLRLQPSTPDPDERGISSLNGVVSVLLIFSASLAFWPHFSPEAWITCLSALSLFWLGAGRFLKSRTLAIAGQANLAASSLCFIYQAITGHPDWYHAITPVMAFLLYSVAGSEWIHRQRRHVPESWMFALGAARTGLVLMTWVWVLEFVDSQWRFAILSMLGCGVTLWGAATSVAGRATVGSSLVVTGYLILVPHYLLGGEVHFIDAAATLVLLLRQLWVKLAPETFHLSDTHQQAMVWTGGAALWLWVTRWAMDLQGGYLLTVAWSVLGLILIGIGFLLKAGDHRRLGILVLAVALLRIFLFDIWELSLAYRVASFFALGAVLILLGYLYNRISSETEGMEGQAR